MGFLMKMKIITVMMIKVKYEMMLQSASLGMIWLRGHVADGVQWIEMAAYIVVAANIVVRMFVKDNLMMKINQIREEKESELVNNGSLLGSIML